MNPVLAQNINLLVEQALREDLSTGGDITGNALINRKGSAAIYARQTGRIAGLPVAERVFHSMDPSLQLHLKATEGAKVEKGGEIIRISGSLLSVLAAERTALNFLSRLCGIATLTRQYIDRIKHTSARLLDTRKTTPGWRALEKYATRVGGATNHRQGLWDMFLIKENHIRIAGSVTNAVTACQTYMKKHSFKVKVEVEAQSIQQVREAFDCGVHRIMLDNMSPDEMRTCVEWVDGRIALEASGNITLQNIADVAETGVDYISVGAITHSVPAFDLSLLVLDE